MAGGGARRALARRVLARKCGEGVSGTDIWDSRSGDLRPTSSGFWCDWRKAMT